MIMLTESWHVLSKNTFNISVKEEERVRDDKDDPFGLDDIEENTVQTLGADLAGLKEKLGDQVDLNITPDEFTNFDIEVATTHGRLSNSLISTMTKWMLLATKMTEVLKVNLPSNQELKK